MASDGVTTTSVGFSTSDFAAGIPGSLVSTDYHLLLDDYGLLEPDPSGVTLSGLTPGATVYNLYLYSEVVGLSGYAATFTIGGVSQTTSSTGNDTSLVAAPNVGSNYVYFSGLTPNGSNDIVISMINPSG